MTVLLECINEIQHFPQFAIILIFTKFKVLLYNCPIICMPSYWSILHINSLHHMLVLSSRLGWLKLTANGWNVSVFALSMASLSSLNHNKIPHVQPNLFNKINIQTLIKYTDIYSLTAPYPKSTGWEGKSIQMIFLCIGM